TQASVGTPARSTAAKAFRRLAGRNMTSPRSWLARTSLIQGGGILTAGAGREQLPAAVVGGVLDYGIGGALDHDADEPFTSHARALVDVQRVTGAAAGPTHD